MRPLAGLFLLLALPASVAAAEPLIVALLRTGPQHPPLLRLALSLENGQWSGLDNKLGELAQNTGLPAFVYDDKKPTPTVELQQIGRLLSAAPMDLQHWQGYPPAARQRTIARTALHAEILRWRCERSWSLRLDRADAAADEPVLFTNRTAEVHFFVAGLPAAGHEADLSIATAEQQNEALVLYRSQASRWAKALGPGDASALLQGSVAYEQKSQHADLPICRTAGSWWCRQACARWGVSPRMRTVARCP